MAWSPDPQPGGPQRRAMDHVPAPPSARAQPTTVRLHGDERVDEFGWLRHRGDPEVLAYLEAENTRNR